jgi:tRNA-splicing ligase RtcB
MIEVTGKYANAIIFTDLVDDGAIQQIQTLCDQEFVKGSKIRIMPDVHSGAGCTIGTTMTITDKIVPNLVGVDIGCGMEVVRLEEKSLDLHKLDKYIRANIPSGFDVRRNAHAYNERIDLYELRCKGHVNLSRERLSIGTLGGGNHFIEVNKDKQDRLYLVVHSGSRQLGLEVANHYQRKGYEALRSEKTGSKIPKTLAYVSGKLFNDYLHDMKIIQQFAMLNRKAMVLEIVEGMNLTVVDRFTTIHNYIDTDSMILRKGAVSAKKGERFLLPMNMRDGSLICIGKGNSEWNYSAPHGAGRLMSRTQAKEKLTLTQYKATMEGIFSTCINKDTLDECPLAYKPAEEIFKNIQDTAIIEEIIKPIYNFKAAE